jgi:Circularly permutated YpsA SLOG family
MTRYRLTAIVSGGQTGADRGGLDAAIALGLGWGGWAPAGLRSEDGQIPEIYAARMKCTSSIDYGMRTRLNVQDSDGTLLVSFAAQLTGGSAFTEKTAEKMRKPYLHLVLPGRGTTRVPDEVRAGVLEWISDCRISVLNVAGPRESKEPGLQAAVRDALVWIFEDEAAAPTVGQIANAVSEVARELFGVSDVAMPQCFEDVVVSDAAEGAMRRAIQLMNADLDRVSPNQDGHIALNDVDAGSNPATRTDEEPT